jgi:hypothetical protein
VSRAPAAAAADLAVTGQVAVAAVMAAAVVVVVGPAVAAVVADGLPGANLAGR